MDKRIPIRQARQIAQFQRKIEQICVCGHAYGDHKVKMPQPCGVCACELFLKRLTLHEDRPEKEREKP